MTSDSVSRAGMDGGQLITELFFVYCVADICWLCLVWASWSTRRYGSYSAQWPLKFVQLSQTIPGMWL